MSETCVLERNPKGSWLLGDRWYVWRGVEIIGRGATRDRAARKARKFLEIERKSRRFRISANPTADRIPLTDARRR